VSNSCIVFLDLNIEARVQQHPNEYIRGATLRFLQKISRDSELLEPLVPICRSCLEHRHSYVRKNAVFAIYAIYREFEHLIPDAPELIQTFLAAESDATCKRNAFVFLSNCAMPKAVEYILSVFDQVPGMDELLQMSIIEVIKLDCKTDSIHRVSLVLFVSTRHLLMPSFFLLCNSLGSSC
jgi:coatomer subunit beta